MTIQEPDLNGITFYGTSGCYGCKSLQDFLNENKIEYTYIDCTSCFPDDVTSISLFIDKHIRCFHEYCEQYKNTIIFPIVFKNGKFVGYSNTTEGYIKYITDN
jgi:glutaredoxin